MANYTLCVTAFAGGSPRFALQAFSGTPSAAITVSGLYCLGYLDAGCVTNTGNMSYNSAGITFFPSTSSPTFIFPTSSPPAPTWSTITSIRIINIVINGQTYGGEGPYVIGPDTITLKLAYCQPSGVFPCVATSPTPTPTPTLTPTNTPTATVTPTVTKTPTSTPIVCGSGTTTGSYYYTDCCGQLVTGNASGVIVAFDYTQPNSGVNKLQVAASVPCSTPTPTPTNTTTKTPTPTPTNTRTPGLTPSNTPSVTPSNTPSAVLKEQNSCDVITLFPLGATCVTISQPISSTSLDGSLSLAITGGTAPYTISWYKNDLFMGGTKTLLNKDAGTYKAVVVDTYGDFTATTFCSLVAPTPSPTPTNTATPTPTATPNWPDLCLYITSPTETFSPIQFVPTAAYNNKPTWTSGNYQILWDTNLSRWNITNLVVQGGQLVSTDTSNVPLASWSVAGIQGSTQPNISMVEGTCSLTLPLTVQIQKQDNSCTGQQVTNGSIIISANGGTTPYQYSINGGLNFQSNNVFNGLNAGTYQVVTKDYLGVTVSNNIVIANSQSVTSYVVSVQNIQTTANSPQNSDSSWIVNVSPSIPIGTTINFNLNIDSYQYVNGPGEGTITSISNVTKNQISQSVSTQSTSPSIATIRPNCSPYEFTSTTISQNYSLSMTYGDVISGTSSSSLLITNAIVDQNSGCATLLQQSINVFVDQVTSQGCTCCTVVANSQAFGGITNHTLEATQSDQTPSYFSSFMGFGPSSNSACNDRSYDFVRYSNCETVSSGCYLYSGSPNNPQIVTGQTFVADVNTKVWTVNPATGQITGEALTPGGIPIIC